jgi:hypothetical protein
MSLQAQAQAAVAAEQRRAAEATSAANYRASALAEQQRQQSAEQARADAERRASLPVIVDAAPPAALTDSGIVTIRQQPVPAAPAAPAPSQTAVVPLPQANVDAFLAEHRRYDPDGVAALQREWGADLPINLAYFNRWTANHLTPEQRDRLIAEGFDVLPLIRLVTGFGREEAHSAPTSLSTTTKGNPMAETLHRADAQKRFDKLSAAIHEARWRGDHIAVRALDAERALLADALFPGSSEPGPTEKRIV